MNVTKAFKLVLFVMSIEVIWVKWEACYGFKVRCPENSLRWML